MNKQEFQKTIRNMEPPKHFSALTFKEAFNEGFNSAKNNALFNSCFLNEPEKPVVPKYVADMIVKRKKQGDSLVATLVNLGAFGDAQRWIRKGDNGDTFAKAWLFGYEVEKEKLYTAKLKLTNEYLGYESQLNGLLHYKVPDSSAKGATAFHFTEDDLVKYHILGNDTYEVREVEDE